MTFIYYATVSYLAASLISSGLHHGTKIAGFSEIVQSHRVVPRMIAPLITMLVTLCELAAGGAALAALFSPKIAVWASLIFAGCTAMGLAFSIYVSRLLRDPEGITSCGCSAFSSPLTRASVIPAIALTLVSLLALATAGFVRTPLTELPRMMLMLPVCWGVTLALIINLLPASMPRPMTF